MSDKKSELFEEAVADASAVREIHLENAKEAILERFTPKLKKIIQDKMLEASEDEDEEELEMDIDSGEEDDETDDVSDEQEKPEEQDGEDEEDDESDDEENMSEDYELTEDDLEEITDYVMDLGEDVALDDRHSNPDSADQHSNKQPQHDNDQLLDIDNLGTGYDDEQISDVVLDEIQKELGLKENDTNPDRTMDEIEDILNELEEDGYMDDYMAGTSGELSKGEPEDAYMDEPMDDDKPMDEPMDDEYMDDYMGYMENDDLDEGEETEFEIDLREYGVTDVDREDMSDLGDVDSTYIDVVNDLVGDGDDVGNTFDTEGPGARMNQTEPEADPLGEDTEYDVSGVLQEEEDEDEVQRLRQQNKKLKKERDKAQKAAKILRERVRSSKLLSKKLVYTNKLFNNLNLNSKQRQRVVESFERADTEREVELTFANLADTLQEQEGGAQRSQQLDESIDRASNNQRDTGGSGIDSDKRILKEDQDFSERMQELAGIL